MQRLRAKKWNLAALTQRTCKAPARMRAEGERSTASLKSPKARLMYFLAAVVPASAGEVQRALHRVLPYENAGRRPPARCRARWRARGRLLARRRPRATKTWRFHRVETPSNDEPLPQRQADSKP